MRNIAEPNVAILQYNLEGLKKDGKIAFCHPGYESADHRLSTHDMTQLVDEAELGKGINAITANCQASQSQAARKIGRSGACGYGRFQR